MSIYGVIIIMKWTQRVKERDSNGWICMWFYDVNGDYTRFESDILCVIYSVRVIDVVSLHEPPFNVPIENKSRIGIEGRSLFSWVWSVTINLSLSFVQRRNPCAREGHRRKWLLSLCVCVYMAISNKLRSKIISLLCLRFPLSRFFFWASSILRLRACTQPNHYAFFIWKW